MPPSVTVNVQNGVPSNGLALVAGEHFVWTNPTPNVVTLNNCEAFCTQSSYTVPAQSGTTPGETVAQINSNPGGWTFQELPVGTWKPGGVQPGNPRIQNPGKPAEQREVA